MRVPPHGFVPAVVWMMETWKGREWAGATMPLTMRLLGNGNETWNGPPQGQEAEIYYLLN